MASELSYRDRNPHQVEKINCMMTRLWPRYKLPWFQEMASKKWKQTDPGTEDKLLKTIKVTLVRPLMTSFKMTVTDDCAVSACSPPLSAYTPWNTPRKALAHWWQREIGLWTWVHLLSQWPASRIKLLFLSTNTFLSSVSFLSHKQPDQSLVTILDQEV